MQIQIHEQGSKRIAEIISGNIILHSADDGLQLMADLYYQDVEKIIVHEKNITPAFFDLKTRLAGEVLQKFSNYKIQLAIVGDFSRYPGQSIKDFIFESNKGKLVNFLPDVEAAKERLFR
ncbi:uncharacterized protein DUF4180 [Chitinophaga polysaccharea]|uniref:Uncharacterized protein DUF4180 n=1 Tax=Chitinophaga polysaccharea TaxID=1293035 RepID=A0A561P7G0_9BACT|nr:DUF4180 domain-containing protein [Chitinophaga polysaccharea]TWF33986.1 uncharacterized protein DUF4180 [Chitinophaga polysaccharea]